MQGWWKPLEKRNVKYPMSKINNAGIQNKSLKMVIPSNTVCDVTLKVCALNNFNKQRSSWDVKHFGVSAKCYL